MTVPDLAIASVLLCGLFIVAVILSVIGQVIWTWWSECLDGAAIDIE